MGVILFDYRLQLRYNRIVMNAIIVIPAYNESQNIKLLIEEILRWTPGIHILVIDDNSPDGTGEVVDKLHTTYPSVSILHRAKKEGLGYAYIAGFKETLKRDFEYILQMDADFSHRPEYIPLFLSAIVDCDVVLGSRFLNAERKPINVSRFSLWANRYVQIMTGLKISDCLGGFKCFRRSVIENIELDKFISRGFIFQAEFLYRALRKGFSIQEIPIIFEPRNSGFSKKSGKIIAEAFFKTPLLRLYT